MSDRDRALDWHGAPRFQRIDFGAAQGLRLLERVKVIAAETGGREAVRKSTRGTKQTVLCLTMLVRGKPREFASLSDAGRAVNRLAHHVLRSIRRGGPCGGHRFAYPPGVQLPARAKRPVKRRHA